MQKNLVIVESPGKIKTLEKALGKDYKVVASYGHIRDLKKKEMSVDLDKFAPEYEIPNDKLNVVKELKAQAAKAETIWLASDDDREGEAISWHLSYVLGLDPNVTKRIVFHSITKAEVEQAIQHPRTINMGMVNAQQARRVLDRLVGFKLSPVLWKKLKPNLSAGRVQSVATRLIVEREKEIETFKSESSYKIVAEFEHDGTTLRATLAHSIKTEAEAEEFLTMCKGKKYTIVDIQKKPMKKSPAPPFTTSTLQQEAARKFGFTLAQTMMIAQHLYEAGHITYMRTDSENLSALCINTTKEEIINHLGDKYSRPRQYRTTEKGAQEAHEAIRPTYVSNHEIEGTAQEKRLYDLIWKRTVACQMAEAETEKTIITIKADGMDEYPFTATGEVVTFDGFLRVYRESFDDDTPQNETDDVILPPMKLGETLNAKEIVATERFTQHPPRYTEASLQKKMKELGIGRPSTWAPTVTTIQQHGYVEKMDKRGEERTYNTLKLTGDKIKKTKKKETFGSEKSKLLPTDIGLVVTEFLMQSFPEIIDYDFTANIEKKFDAIVNGDEDWQTMIRQFYGTFEPMVDNAMQERNEHKVGERILGKEPGTGRPVSVKIGRFGPMVQIGTSNQEEKPRFAQLNKGQSIQTITLEEAIDLFKLPRTLGTYEQEDVTIGTGRFGPYVQHAKKYVSIPKNIDPLQITIQQAIDLIEEKRKGEAASHLKKFDEDPELEVMNGRYGAYLKYKGTNYKLPKTLAANPLDITYQQCLEIINTPQPEKKRKKKK